MGNKAQSPGCKAPFCKMPVVCPGLLLSAASTCFEYQAFQSLSVAMEQGAGQGMVERPGCCFCRQEAWFLSGVRRYPGVFL